MSTVLAVCPDGALDEGWEAALEAAGHTVLIARRMDEGVSRLREGGIDVIVIGERSGERALTSFISTMERLPDPPPFILVSGSPRAPEISAHLGAAAFLPGPCATADLAEVIARFAELPATSPIEDEPTQPRRFDGSEVV